MGFLLIVFLCSVLGAGIGFLSLAASDRKNWKKYQEYVIPSAFIGAFLAGMFGGIFGAIESGKVSHNEDPIELGCKARTFKTPIISTIRERTVDGNFILGTGGISSVDRYYAYVEYEPGFKLTTFRTRNTYIKEGYSDPYYQRTDYYCKRTFRNWFWFGTVKPRYNKGRFGTLHVPENTVLREFKL